MKGIIFIGLQASGKSTFFLEQFYKTHIRLNLDMLRTRNREKILFNACLEAKQPVVIDNTNPTRVDRERYISSFKDKRFEIFGYFFESNLKSCLDRNAMREGKECIPDIGIKSTYKKLESPIFAEGFDKIFSVKIENEGFVIKEWKR